MSKKAASLPPPDPLFFAEGTSAADAAAAHGSVITGLSMGAGQAGISSDRVMQEAVRGLMGDVADPHFQRTVEETLQEMASGAGDGGAGGRDAADPLSDGHIAASVFSSLASHSGAAGAQAIAQTMGMMARLGGGVGAADAPQPAGALPGSDAAQATEALSDELIKNMMSEFEGMGRKEDFAQVTDNMMRQLLSKDIMCVAWLSQRVWRALCALRPSLSHTSARALTAALAAGTSPCATSRSASPSGWPCTRMTCSRPSTTTMATCT